MKESDAVRIHHMLDAANEAVSFITNRSREDLDTNRMLTLSVVKSIEIIGEAAARVSNDLKAEHPEIRWQAITAMRNRLIHGYFEVDKDVVWETVTRELPRLVPGLEAILRT